MRKKTRENLNYIQKERLNECVMDGWALLCVILYIFFCVRCQKRKTNIFSYSIYFCMYFTFCNGMRVVRMDTENFPKKMRIKGKK